MNLTVQLFRVFWSVASFVSVETNNHYQYYGTCIKQLFLVSLYILFMSLPNKPCGLFPF